MIDALPKSPTFNENRILVNKLLKLAAVIILFASCHGNQRLGAARVPVNKTALNEGSIGQTELVHLLRATPGLQISNRGGTYEILVRGSRSINRPNTPLYVLDGVPLGRDYDSVARSVYVNLVASVKVITPANAAIYGSRGQNGVIDIRTKN